MQQGHNGKNFNNSCYIYRSACNFLCSAVPRYSLLLPNPLVGLFF